MQNAKPRKIQMKRFLNKALTKANRHYNFALEIGMPEGFIQKLDNRCWALRDKLSEVTWLPID